MATVAVQCARRRRRAAGLAVKPRTAVRPGAGSLESAHQVGFRRPFIITRNVQLFLAAVGLAPRAFAGFTTPTLLPSTATGTTTDGGRMVTLTGSFDFPNTVQPGYPLNLVVSQGTSFVRYPILGPAVTGTSVALADGFLTAAELDGLLADGTAATPRVRVLTVTASDIRVALPATLGPGPTRAVLFTILPDGSVISNPIDFVLP